MQTIMMISKELFSRIGEDDISGLAAQLAYFFLLSLLPFMIFLLTLLGYLRIDEDRVLTFVNTYAPPETFDLITNNITPLLYNDSGGFLSVVGLLGTLWAASNGVNAIMRAFNRAYRVEENRPFLVTRFIAIVLTIVMLLVIVIAFLLPILGHAIGIYIFSFFGMSNSFIAMWDSLRWVISSVIFFIVLSFLFSTAPNKRVRFKETLVGAAIAMVGWQCVSLLFSFYVSNLGNFSATYGSLGGVIVLMIWFYFTGIVIIMGGEVNAILHQRRVDRKAS